MRQNVSHSVQIYTGDNPVSMHPPGRAFRHQELRTRRENYPVASILLPRPMRKPVRVIYDFFRLADTIADEGELSPAERGKHIGDLRRKLDAARGGIHRPADDDSVSRLSRIIVEYRLNFQWFHDILYAMEKDIHFRRPPDLASVLEHAQLVSSPVGRMMLRLGNEESPENEAFSDAICCSMLLIDVLHDIGEDWQKGRVYLPASHMTKFGIADAYLEERIVDDRWRAFMKFEIAIARHLMSLGLPLVDRLRSRRFRIELQAIICSALHVLKMLENADYDVYSLRRGFRFQDWAAVAYAVGNARFGERNRVLSR